MTHAGLLQNVPDRKTLRRVELIALVDLLEQETLDLRLKILFHQNPDICHAKVVYWVAVARWFLKEESDATQRGRRLRKLLKKIRLQVEILRQENPLFPFICGIEFDPQSSYWEKQVRDAKQTLQSLELHLYQQRTSRNAGSIKPIVKAPRREPCEDRTNQTPPFFPGLRSLVGQGKRVIVVGGQPKGKVDRTAHVLPFRIEWVGSEKVRAVQSACKAARSGKVVGVLLLQRWAGHWIQRSLKAACGERVPIIYIQRDSSSALTQGLTTLERLLTTSQSSLGSSSA